MDIKTMYANLSIQSMVQCKVDMTGIKPSVKHTITLGTLPLAQTHVSESRRKMEIV